MVLFPPPFYFVYDISNLLSYIQNNFSYELARHIMGTIFLVTIYDGTGQKFRHASFNDDVKIKWRKRIRAYGRSMILSFLVSNFLSYSGNLNRGTKVWYFHYCSTSCFKKMYCSDWMHCMYIYVCGRKKYLNRTLAINSPFQTFAVGLLLEFID